jgi:DNA replication protein DnaC
MIDQETVEMLRKMRMTAMADELSHQLQDSTFNELGFEERLGLMVTAEWNRRQTNTVQRLIKNANFSAPAAAVEEIEYYEDRKLDKAQILRLSSCKFVDEGHHIILEGASGNGKTYIACALGNAACRRFKKVRYIRMPELLDELNIARSGGELKKCLSNYKKVDLLILDEWLIRPLTPQESYDLLEIVETRCQRSMIFCTQYSTDGWYTRIDSNPESASPVSDAIMDRFMQALGVKACLLGWKVIFCNATTLATELCEAHDDYQLRKMEKTLSGADLLLIDELSYARFNQEESEMLFKVIAERSERASTVITTNLEFSKWTEMFASETLVAALVDRLTYHSSVLNMNGQSYRLHSSKQKMTKI